MKWIDPHKIRLLSDAAVLLTVYVGAGLFVLMIIVGGTIWLSIMRKGE